MTESSLKYIAIANASEKGSASPMLPERRGSDRNERSQGARLSLSIRKVTLHTSYMLLVGEAWRRGVKPFKIRRKGTSA